MKNFEAEMKRYGVTLSDIQAVLGCAERTAWNKVYSKTDFTLPEAFKIRDSLFPTLRMEYLFAQDSERS